MINILSNIILGVWILFMVWLIYFWTKDTKQSIKNNKKLQE
jgi:hypothetical protein